MPAMFESIDGSNFSVTIECTGDLYITSYFAQMKLKLSYSLMCKKD